MDRKILIACSGRRTQKADLLARAFAGDEAAEWELLRKDEGDDANFSKDFMDKETARLAKFMALEEASDAVSEGLADGDYPAPVGERRLVDFYHRTGPFGTAAVYERRPVAGGWSWVKAAEHAPYDAALIAPEDGRTAQEAKDLLWRASLFCEPEAKILLCAEHDEVTLQLTSAGRSAEEAYRLIAPTGCRLERLERFVRFSDCQPQTMAYYEIAGT